MIDALPLTFFGQVIAAFIGTAAFAILFGVPRRYYCSCGAVGMLGWIVYLLLTRCAGISPTESTFCAAAFVCLMSKVFAVIIKCPITVFLICGIFPLVPGGGIFWTAYHIVSNHMHQALESGFLALKLVVAIVLGILIVNEIPSRWFQILNHIPVKNSEPSRH